MPAIKLKALFLTSFIASLPFGGLSNAAENSAMIAWTMDDVIQSVDVSLDGKEIMVLRAASKEGPYVIEVYKTGKLDAEPVRFGGGKTQILQAGWVANGFLYVDAYRDLRRANRFNQERRQAIIKSNGKGDWVEIDKDHQVTFVNRLPDQENWILISTDINDNDIPDIVKFNIRTGAKVSVHRGTSKIPGGYGVDFDGTVRFASAYDFAVNGFKTWARKKGKDDWILINTTTSKGRERYGVAGIDKENPNQFIIAAHRGENTVGLYFLDLDTMAYSERLFGHPTYDAGGVIRSQKDADRGRILGFSYTGKYLKRYFIDEAEKALYDGIGALFEGDNITLESRSEDDNVIIVFTQSAKNPGAYYLLENKSKLTFLGNRKPLLKKEMLSDVKYVSYKARDGRKIRTYVTLPTSGEKPFPTVVMPHGGPWSRDSQLYDEWAQLMAYKGYMVVQPQFRGSAGLGLDLWLAGDAKWGHEMQDDLDDAVLFLVKRGLADRERLAIHGYSYGGYAAFAATVRANPLYKCAIAGAGVSDLNSIGAGLSQNPFLRELQKPTIKGVSPIDHVKDASIPILVMHGDRDTIAHTKHSRWFVAELKKYNKEHKYIEIEGMRHQGWTWTQKHREIYYTNLIDWLDNRCFN